MKHADCCVAAFDEGYAMRRNWAPFRAAAAACAVSALVALGACQQQAPSGEAAGGAGDIEEKQRAQAEQSLAALGGPATPEQRALYEGDFTASGSSAVGAGEGAWDLFLLSNYAQFLRPGLGEDGGVTGERQYRQQGMRVSAGPIIVTIKAQDCPTVDGGTQPYVAEVLFEGVAYAGCARRGISDAERPTWASEIALLLPAIDACLARVQSAPGRVTLAIGIDEGQTQVRMREADGGRYGCVVSSSNAVVVYDPLLESDTLAGEGDPEFVRAPGTPPRATNCRTVTEARTPGGETLGWLVRRTC